jgi:hypothetical protein
MIPAHLAPLSLDAPWQKLPRPVRDAILYGIDPK